MNKGGSGRNIIFDGTNSPLNIISSFCPEPRKCAKPLTTRVQWITYSLGGP
eukprot:UN16932